MKTSIFARASIIRLFKERKAVRLSPSFFSFFFFQFIAFYPVRASGDEYVCTAVGEVKRVAVLVDTAAVCRTLSLVVAESAVTTLQCAKILTVVVVHCCRGQRVDRENATMVLTAVL